MLSGLLKTNKRSIVLLLVLTILPSLVSFISLIIVYNYASSLQAFLLPQWILFYLACSITMALALTPTTYIALLSGYFLGWASLMGLIPSYVVASLIGFFLAVKIDKGNLLNQLKENKKISSTTENLKKDEFWVIFFCRISPVLPFAMMNVFLSFMNVKLKNFILGSVLGMLPRTILSVWIGLTAGDIVDIVTKNNQPGISTYLMVFFMLVSAIGLYFIFVRAIKKYQS